MGRKYGFGKYGADTYDLNVEPAPIEIWVPVSEENVCEVPNIWASSLPEFQCEHVDG